MGELGDLLRETREAKGLSLAQVEQEIKIRRRLLEALEEENYDALPAPVFVKGFLRNYALFLDLEPERVVELYKADVGSVTDPIYAPQTLAEPLESESTGVPAVIGILLLIVLLSIAAWISHRQGWIGLPLLSEGQMATPTVTPSLTSTITVTATKRAALLDTKVPTGTATVTETYVATRTSTAIATKTLTASPTRTRTTLPTMTPSSSPTRTATRTRTPQPSPTATTDQEPTATVSPSATPLRPLTAIQVELEYEADAWMRIYADGTEVYEGTVSSGSKQTWEATQQLYVHCGYGSGVKARVNGSDYGFLSEEPDTVHVEWALEAGTPSVESAQTPTQIVLPSRSATLPPLTTGVEMLPTNL